MKYQRVPMPPDNLEATVARYNSFVDAGMDEDFGKPKPLYKIAKPPFYAAWATPVLHDTRAGLRINANCQVMDMNGQVIPGLYCGGESAGGFSEHGLARRHLPGLHRRASRDRSRRLKHFDPGRKANPVIAPHLSLPPTCHCPPSVIAPHLSLRGALATKQAPPTPGIASSQALLAMTVGRAMTGESGDSS